MSLTPRSGKRGRFAKVSALPLLNKGRVAVVGDRPSTIRRIHLARFSHETERPRSKAFQPEDVIFYFEG